MTEPLPGAVKRRGDTNRRIAARRRPLMGRPEAIPGRTGVYWSSASLPFRMPPDLSMV